MAWCWTGNKPSSKPKMTQIPCLTSKFVQVVAWCWTSNKPLTKPMRIHLSNAHAASLGPAELMNGWLTSGTKYVVVFTFQCIQNKQGVTTDKDLMILSSAVSSGLLFRQQIMSRRMVEDMATLWPGCRCVYRCAWLGHWYSTVSIGANLILCLLWLEDWMINLKEPKKFARSPVTISKDIIWPKRSHLDLLIY